jgi:hypothetical protein
MVEFDATNAMGGLGNASSGFINSNMSLNTVLSLLGHTSVFNNAAMDIVYDPTVSTNVGFIAANYIGDSSAQGNYSVFYDMSGMLVGSHKGTSSTPTTVGNVGYGTPVKDAVISRPAYTATTGFATLQNSTNALLVYPNPVTSNTRIVLPAGSAAAVTVDVINMNGNIAHSYQYAPGIYNLDVDMSTLPAGLYNLHVSGNLISSYNLKVVKE